MIYLTRPEKFNATRKLYVDSWSEEKNNEAFGKCCIKNWHGYNYIFHVTVSGVRDTLTGFVMEVRLLSGLIQEHVLKHFDHSNLNLGEYFIPNDTQPNSEVVCRAIFNQLQPFITQATLHSVRIHETDTTYVEYLV